MKPQGDDMNTLQPIMTVDVWSDFVCPWCWIAKRRFEVALASFEGKALIQVNYKAYRIAPGYQPEPMISALEKKFGSSTAAQGMIHAVEQAATEAGLTYRFDTMQFGDTSRVHALLAAVHHSPLRAKLSEHLYKTSISEGRSIFNRDSLGEIAEEVGVSAATVEQAWSDKSLIDLIFEDEKAAQRVGRGVPLFLFNDSFYLSGAQPTETFSKALRQMYTDALMDSSEGQTCGLDGCGG